MNSDYRSALLRCETDIDEVLQRLSGDEALYERCLALFLEDPSMAALDRALASSSWDEAFTAVHALKGVAGNMGFIPLFHAAAEMVILIRAGRTMELRAAYSELNRCYDEISEVIRQYCETPAEE